MKGSNNGQRRREEKRRRKQMRRILAGLNLQRRARRPIR